MRRARCRPRRIVHDPKIAAPYVQPVEGKHECHIVRLNEGIALNIGAGGKVVGSETPDAKEVQGSGKMPSLPIRCDDGVRNRLCIITYWASSGEYSISGLEW